jgi:hypothetical protein
MTTLTDTHLWNRIGRRWLATMLLVSLTFAIGTTEYSNAKPDSAPAGLFIKARSSDEVEGTVLVSIGMEPGHNKGSYLAPFLHIVPDADGKGISVSAGGVGELGGTAFVNIGIGPGHNKGSYTMTYSDTVQSYITTVLGFTDKMDDYGPINITTTLGLDSGAVDFNRAYVPASTSRDIVSEDRNLQLTLVSTDTFPSEAYVVVVPSYAPPGPPPLGHRLLGSAYSVRASGAVLVADRPMDLRLYYSEATLAGADPHTLAIFAWDAYHERWDNLGGTLFSTQQYVSVATRRFTTYALMATPSWRDEFDDLSGLDLAQLNNVAWGRTPGNRTLVLTSTATSGHAVSNPITPMTDLATWGNLIFTSTVDLPTTTLTIDVLSLDGPVLLTDVASGVNLAGLDPAQYHALKLRATLSSTVRGETPALDAWQLTWQVEERHIYLPVVWR